MCRKTENKQSVFHMGGIIRDQNGDSAANAGQSTFSSSAAAVVTVPVYRAELSESEAASFKQTALVLGGKHPVVLFAPEGIDLTRYREIYPDFTVEYFPGDFFRSVSDYSRLLLSKEFYLRFAEFEWLLICQLDAWVFRDELAYWCKKGYDYIGAPFVQRYGRSEEIIIGNGGFSLRRIEAMLRVLDAPEKRMFPPALLLRFFRNYLFSGKYLASLRPLGRLCGLYPNTRGRYLEQIRREKFNSEDMVYYFLSREFTDDGLFMPGIDDAARFSLDAQPGRFFRELPFGCHAWLKNGADFWRTYVRNKPESNGK